VIFDLDGTLVDSEGLGTQAFLDLLPDLKQGLAELVGYYRGMRLSNILEDLELRLQRSLPADFELRYRQHVASLFASELRATPGTIDMLDRNVFPRCVASGGPRQKIEQALSVTGLSRYFGWRVFSSYDVGSWKPEAGLFLHAAQKMQYPPGRCVVVEDSNLGIDAALAASMQVIFYAPNENTVGTKAHGVLRHMSQLPDVLNGLSARA
jgi:HAD superfamily hydrolase (TIGR01509 family)